MNLSLFVRLSRFLDHSLRKVSFIHIAKKPQREHAKSKALLDMKFASPIVDVIYFYDAVFLAGKLN